MEGVGLELKSATPCSTEVCVHTAEGQHGNGGYDVEGKAKKRRVRGTAG